MKGNTNTKLVGVAALVFTLVGIVWLVSALGIVSFQAAPGSGTQINLGGGTGGNGAGPDLTFCGGLNTVSLSGSSQNVANVSASFIDAAFRTANSVLPSVTIATATGTAGTAETLTTIAIPCGADNARGVVYSVPSGDNNGDVLGTYDIVRGPRVIKGQGSVGDELRMTMRDTQLANLSQNQVEDPTEAAVAIAAGGTRSLYLDVEGGNIGGTRFGNKQGIWLFIDYIRPAAINSIALDNAVEIGTCSSSNLAAAYTSAGMSLPAGVDTTFEKAAQVTSADRCYLIPSTGASSALRRMAITVVAGATDPTTTDDATLTFSDVQIHEYQGKVYVGSVDPSGTDVGSSDSVVTLNFS